MDFLRQLVRGVVQAWSRLSGSARVNIGVAALVSIAAIVAMVFFVGGRQYVVLESGLTSEDASVILSYLDDEGVPYRTRENGAVILVPVDMKNRVIVGLGRLQLPRRGGAAAPARQGFLTTRFQQEEYAKQALILKLEDDLAGLDFVNSAKVNLREAPETFLTGEQKPSEAYVLLDLKRAVSPEEIKVVLEIVETAGGPNLPRDKVSISTTRGQSLHGATGDGFSSVASDKLEVKADYDRYYTEKIGKALEDARIRCIVTADVQLDDKTVNETKEVLAAEGTPVATWSENIEVNSGERPPEGAPGITANPPENVVSGGTQTTETTTRELQNLETGKTTTETKVEPGKIESITVAAYIQGNYEKGENGEEKYIGLTEDEIQSLKEFILSAAGPIAKAEGIKVIARDLRPERIAAEVTGLGAVGTARMWETLLTLASWCGKIGLVVVMFFVVRHFARNARIVLPEEQEELVEIPEATARDLARREVAGEVERMSQEAPDAVVALLRSWMSEES